LKPAGQGVSATAETAGKPGDLKAAEKDAADIMGGNATGDNRRVDVAIAHHAKTDKRAGIGTAQGGVVASPIKLNWKWGRS
jgi:hypothetical protein